ncbi:restriction endonuclease subunit S, partial [Paraburkholderia strydomiana]
MAAVEKLVTDHLDLWTAAIKRKSAAGRGSSSRVELYGIKKLRTLILDLAVRGMLLPQDPRDEPASELLKKIAAEKAKRVKEGEIKADKPLPAIEDVEKPFKLPSGWLWERLPNISFFQEGPGIMAKDFRSAGVPLIRISGMHGTLVSLNGCNFLDREMVAKKWNHFCLEEGDILLSSSASLGKVSKVGNDAVGGVAYTGLIRFKPYKPLFDDYLIRFFGSNEFVRQIDDSKKGAAIMHFGPTHLRWMIVPLPPLAEQHRIVAKVNELMTLCDQLEQQTDASLSAHQTLVKTLLNALTSAADHAQFASAWQRIVEHFDTLFTSEESTDQLKQTILQLAVMGKLVPQDPNDEPARELLEKIASETAKLVKEGKIKKEKPLTPITEEEKPFELPTGWDWARFD